MTDRPDSSPSPADAYAALTDGAPAPRPPRAPAWGWIGALALSGLGLLAGVVATWPAAGSHAAPTGWPDPPAEVAQAPITAAPLPEVPPSRCADAACAVREAHPDWPLAVCEAIAARRVALGMTGEQVRAARGAPLTQDGARWCYAADCRAGVRVVADRAVEIFEE